MKETFRNLKQFVHRFIEARSHVLPGKRPKSKSKPKCDTRILFVANGLTPTLQLSFIKPLEPLVESGQIATRFIFEGKLYEKSRKLLRKAGLFRWIDDRLTSRFPVMMAGRVGLHFARFRPTVVVFCRYSGPAADQIVWFARKASATIVFHLDDDLLNVPPEIGKEKFRFHNTPARLKTVRYLLDNADLVYCSTEPLKLRLKSHGARGALRAGRIYCSGEVMAPATRRPIRKIGYMGFDHAHDFEIVLPALVTLMRNHPHLEFELFGSIPKPACLDEFGERVHVIPPVPLYHEFMRKFASLEWDIGLCPLADTAFNAVKANTKWVEYTSVGAAVIATGGTIYDDCCAEESGVLVKEPSLWLEELDRLVRDDARRFLLVSTAQQKLREQYSIDRLREQVLDMLDPAVSMRDDREAA